MELLQKHFVEVLEQTFLAGVAVGIWLANRGRKDMGRRVGKLAGRVNKVEGHLGLLKNGDPDGGE